MPSKRGEEVCMDNDDNWEDSNIEGLNEEKILRSLTVA
jgi:hypothetical protein